VTTSSKIVWNTYQRLGIIAIGAVGLVLMYLLQRQFFYDPLQDFVYNPVFDNRPNIEAFRFISGKVIRYILNDIFAIFILMGLFADRKYLRLALAVFLFGLVVLLPAYFIAVFFFLPEVHSFLNHIHRLVLNPVLMLMLIPAIYYQKRLENERGDTMR
jgi:exosortase F-associated protein